MALLFTLTVGVILSILAVSLLGLYYGDYHSQRLQQQAIQAYWNARAGVEHYLDARQLPEKRTYDFGASGDCKLEV
jgi:type II secretory pathway pseudopilin PulG